MKDTAPPRVFISYSHDGQDHQDRVLELAGRLRADGVDAVIDQYVQSPPEGWPSWCRTQIEQSRFVLMVCTETYLRRVDHKEAPGVGHGVLWEGRLISQHLYEAGSVSTKFVPVLLSDGSDTHVPLTVKGGTIYRVETAEGYEALLRLLTDQPLTPMPPLRPRRSLPPRATPQPSPAVDKAEYVVWYGTNRRPNDPRDAGKGYSAGRDNVVHYGSCRVFIPQSHKIGSIGSPWWKRLISLTDDRLRLLSIDEFEQSAYWGSVAAQLAAIDADERSALIFVNGYNLSFWGAAMRAAQIGFDLSVKGAMAFFSWPSRGYTRGYPADEATIEASEGVIGDFMTDFADRSGAATGACHRAQHGQSRGVACGQPPLRPRRRGVPASRSARLFWPPPMSMRMSSGN
jgi:hypothetical protein